MSVVGGEMGARTGARASGATSAAGRLIALGRAELTLLGRSKLMIYSGVFAPLLITYGMKAYFSEQLDPEKTGLSIGALMLPAALGMALLMAVYNNLVGVYVTRREDLVLKRLRTGELADWEILAGGALPAVLITLAQCVLYVAGGSLVLGVGMPKAPHLVALGIVIGVVVMAGLAALTAGITKSAEAAQLTPTPLFMVSLVGSGVFFPLAMLPDRLAQVLELLPLSPVMGLLQAGWTGGATPGETVKQLVIGLVWSGIAVFAGQRWFRWEPRR
ncbi:ABC transporter permease [Streptomyces sp. NPDC050355]|uniref:ABC transporter permease n=1 Tax=Streptomyces sp. NPDC050355 TaxID=3365609 RepID=UPI00378CEBD7